MQTVESRSLTFPIAHLNPCLPTCIVEQETIVDRGNPRILDAGTRVRERLKSETVAEFMNQYRNQINVGSIIVIKTKIKVRAIEASRIAKIYIETSTNLRTTSVEITGSQLVRQSRAVPRAWKCG